MKVKTQKPNLLLKYETTIIKNTIGIQEYSQGTSQPYPHYNSRPKTIPSLNTTIWYPGVSPRDLLAIPSKQLKTKYKFIPKHNKNSIMVRT